MLKDQLNAPLASVFVFPRDEVRSSKPVTERLPTCVVQKISMSLFAGRAFALSVTGAATVVAYGSDQMPCATGFPATVANPCFSAGVGMTAAPSVTVNGMCGNGREATTGCCCGFM